ncbi:MAG TPA: FecR family protein [Alphaproteobacteria bacterium]|nr:FecR family protein [Alphaproteobacteria bacterium]
MTSKVRTSIDEEAVAWFVLLRDIEATREDRSRFADWLGADPRHRRAWREIEGLWAGMDGLRPPEAAPLPLRRRSAFGVERWRLAAVAAAVLLLVAGAGIFWAAQPPGYAAALFADHRTGPDAFKSVALPDGSTVTLSASSALSVAFDGPVRRVELHRGEAYFSVAPDAERPFSVLAAEGRVSVIGTEFDVKLAGRQARVSVASGNVEVSAGASAPMRLSPGQGVRYSHDGIGPVHTVDLADIGTWREGRLVFQGAPLGEVLRDLERYRRGRIVIEDEAVARLPVTGAFDTRRPDAALETIERTLPVKLTRLTDLLILVRAAD